MEFEAPSQKNNPQAVKRGIAGSKTNGSYNLSKLIWFPQAIYMAWPTYLRVPPTVLVPEAHDREV